MRCRSVVATGISDVGGRGNLSAGRSAVAVGDLSRHGAHDSATLLFLLPSVCEDTDRSRQREQSPAKLRLKTKFAKDNGGDAVDIHRDMALLDRGDGGFDRMADRRKASANDTGSLGIGHQREQRRRPRVDWMEAMAEPGNDLLAD